MTMLMNGNRGLMSVLDCPDNVCGPPCRIAAKEYARQRALHRHLVHCRHVPLVEVDSDVALDPRERVVLTDSENHFVARENNRIDHLACLLSVRLAPLETLEFHSNEFSIFDNEPLWRMVLDDLDAFLFRVFELPRRCFEIRP